MDRGEWWVIVHEFAKVWQDWATNIFTSIVIILFGAWGRENTNILTCLFSHVTCIHRDYRILPPWLLEIRYKDVAFFFSFFLSFFFHFDALEWLKLMLLKSNLTRLQLFHWGKDLNLKRCFLFRSAKSCALSLSTGNLSDGKQFFLLWAHGNSFDADQQGKLSYLLGQTFQKKKEAA